MFPLWLMGVAVYRLCENRKMSRPVGWLCMIGPACLMAIYETISNSYTHAFMPLRPDRFPSLAQDFAVNGQSFSIHLIGVASLSDTFGPFLERHSMEIRWIAGATFSVYLVHLPICHFFVALTHGALSLVSVVALTLMSCLVFAEFTERKKYVWKNILQKMSE